MTLEGLKKSKSKILELATRTLEKKNKGYRGEQEDTLYNFKLAAHEFSVQGHPINQKMVLFGYLMKHLISLRYMCGMRKVKPSREEWREKLIDSINYLILLSAMVDEEIDEEGGEREDCLFPPIATYDNTETEYGRNVGDPTIKELKEQINPRTKKGYTDRYIKKRIVEMFEEAHKGEQN